MAARGNCGGGVTELYSGSPYGCIAILRKKLNKNFENVKSRFKERTAAGAEHAAFWPS